LAGTHGQTISDNDGNLCSAGKPSSVKIVNGLYSWFCSFGDSTSDFMNCTAYPPANTPAPVSAKCGDISGGYYSMPYKAQYTASDFNKDTVLAPYTKYPIPDFTLCSVGTPGPLSPTAAVSSLYSMLYKQQISWTCSTSDALGYNATCSAQISFQPSSIPSICGTANKTYPSTATSFGNDTFCGNGYLGPSQHNKDLGGGILNSDYPGYNDTIAFPSPGGSAWWYCYYQSGYRAATCEANISSGGSSCITSWDCPAPQICSSLNTCYSSSSACRFGAYEPNGQCGCLTDSDCKTKEMKCTGASGSWTPGGTPPIYGTCVLKGCTTNSDCDANRTCTNGLCG
jgi:hypothetical protein